MAGCAANWISLATTYIAPNTAQPTLLEYLGRHVLRAERGVCFGQMRERMRRDRRTYAGCTADLCQEMELLIIHDSAQSKVCYHDICVLVLRAE